MFDWLYNAELAWLQWLQHHAWFQGQWTTKFWLFCTKLGDPKWTFTVYFPLLFAIMPRRALQCLIAGAVSEFVNGVLKWVLYGDRPYWYVHEHHSTWRTKHIELIQFPLTCETGPGQGHPESSTPKKAGVDRPQLRLPDRVSLWHALECLVLSSFNIVVWLIFGVLKRLISLNFYVLLLLLVSLSRLYIVAHFPHQIVLGIFAGIILGHCTLRAVDIGSFGWRDSVSLVAILTVPAVILHRALHYFQLDPDWSITKAQRWCTQADWVRIATTPWASLVRDIGALIGLGFVLWLRSITTNHDSLGRDRSKERASSERLQSEWHSLSTIRNWKRRCRVGCSLLSLALVQLLDHFHPPLSIFYVAYFVLNAVYIPLVMICSPLVIASLCDTRRTQFNRKTK